MKSTKRILSAILSVVMILGCLTVGFTAQASASDLVKAVANGGKVDWTGGNVTLADTLVINKDVEIDFNGAVITGPAGKVAIRVDGGNVTLYDGVVLADQGSYSGETGFVKALMNYKPAISINDGDVELNCITAVGSLLRIPNSSTIEVPIGNGINANDGTVVLDNVIAIGMKALDNTKADVTVKDAILAGIYKAVNIYKAVDFGANYEQYETVELLEGFLKDGVNLSANEKKYIASATNSQGDFSVGSVIVNVEKPVFTQPETTFVGGKLNVIANVEPFEHEGVSNRYSYSYTPDYAVIGEDEQAFTADGVQYVASFAGLTEGEEYDVTVNYDLSIKLGKKQKEIVETAFDILAHYIDKAPELLNRFVKDFEDLYVKAESMVGMAYDVVKDSSNYDELLAIIYALEGLEYNGFDGDANAKYDTALKGYVSQINSIYEMSLAGQAGADAMQFYYGTTDAKEAVRKYYADVNSKVADYKFDWNGDGVADSVFAYTYDNEFDLSGDRTQPGYGAGKGLLDVFDEYYAEVKALVYGNSTTEFNDLGAAAEYVGDNWVGLLELVENAVVVLDKAYEIVNGDDFKALLNKVNMGSFASYISAFNTAYKYLDKVMSRVDYFKASSFFNTFIADPQKAGDYCKRYTLKVWDIANNPTKYFGEIPVNGDYVTVDLLDEELNATFTVSTEEQIKDVYVQVQVVGIGSAVINGVTVDTPVYSDEIWFDLGDEITVEPVDNETYGTKFAYMTIDNGGNKLVVDEDFSTKAATNLLITVVFQAEDVDYTNVVFMTDEALSYKYIDSIDFYSGEVWSTQTGHVVAPDFAKMDQCGWSLDKDAENGKPLAEFADEAQAAVEAGQDVMILYAIYDYEENTTVGEHGQTVKFNKDPYVEGEKIYFELSIQLRDTSKKALEAGVILTDINDAAAMTVDKSYKDSGYVFVRTDEFDADGFVKSDVLLTVGVKASVTIYARGYVVWDDGSVTYTTNVVNGTVKAAA